MTKQNINMAFPQENRAEIVGEITIVQKYDVTRRDIDDLLITAFEGGINYWCQSLVVVGDWPSGAEFASGCVSRGSVIELYVPGEDTIYPLTLKALIEGIGQAIQHFNEPSLEAFMDNHDATYADVAVQYALFGDVIYG